MQNRGIVGWSVAAVLALVVLTDKFPSACAPPAETISGEANVVDGDSLEMNGTRIRLHAIDAFEGRQICHRGTSTWDCGAAAANKLRTLVVGRTIDCKKTDTDSYGRTVAICGNGDVDLGAEMVRVGLALAYREFGADYADEEDDARAARRGAWSGEFTAPWDQRRRGGDERPNQPIDDASRAAEQAGGPTNCRGTGIKGNINRAGERIHHVPGSSSYNETIIDESKGERWFCTEREAIDAGWRAPRG